MSGRGYTYDTPLQSIANPAWKSPNISALERATATADVQCADKVGLDNTWRDVESETQTSLIAMSRVALSNDRTESLVGASIVSPEAYHADVGTAANNPADTECKNWASCLYWNENFVGSYWTNTGADGVNKCAYPDLIGYTFNRSLIRSDGLGSPIKNNAAAAANSSPYPLYIYYNENYSGNYDWLPQYTEAWALDYTLNNDASLLNDC